MKRGGLGAMLMFLPAACSGRQTPLSPAGDQAEALHHLLGLMIIVCGSVYALAMGGLGWSLWRALRNGGEPREHRDGPLDRGLYMTAAIIVAGLTALVIGSFFADRALLAARGANAMTVRVTGHQWWWRIEYRDPATGRWIETANELHLPQGRTTRVDLGSADVIHSFWVPNIAGKQDLIPGRRNRLDLTPRRLGWYRGQCAEFCGSQHAHMAFDVMVDTPSRFDSWLETQAQNAKLQPDAAEGGSIFERSCGACHTVRGTAARGRAGPDLTHFASRASIAAGTLPMSRGALQGWIAQPQALKPGTSMPAIPLAPAEADAVAAYVAALK